MYCSQCGKKVSETSFFCSNCGFPIPKEDTTQFLQKQQLSFDAVEDIKRKLKEIDNRKRPPVKKGGAVKTAFESIKKTIKEEASASGLAVFHDDFEEKKLADKKQLILDYPFPTSPEALANFTKYIYSEIEAKRKAPDALTEVWKEKLKQAHRFAKKDLKATEEFGEIQKCYKANKRKDRHEVMRVFVLWFIFPIVAAFIAAIIDQLPMLMFISILAAFWEVFLILYMFDLLDNMIASVKKHSAKQRNIPIILQFLAWFLLLPTLAALITSIIYCSEGFIILFAILFGADAFFLFLFMCEAFEL